MPVYTYPYVQGNPVTTTPASLNSSSSALQLNDNNGYVVKIASDGTVETKWGDTSIKDAIETVKVMRAIVIEMAKDEETCKKFPFLADIAHKWMMESLTK